MKTAVLENIRILDLSRIISGPWCTQTLADLGAEVIKIERPIEGDDTRKMGPFLRDKKGEPTNDSAMYFAANRGKKSVTIDIATPEGADLVRQLAGECDVVVENFKTGALAKYGLDFESLRAIKPDLIYCSITGFGQDGPYANRPAYDFVMQAMSGLMSGSGQPDGAAGSSPMRTGVPLTDIATGLYATIAILAAIMHRSATGQGQYIDMAMIDSSVALNANLAVGYLMTAEVPKRSGNASLAAAPSDLFATSDGQIALAIGNDQQFSALARLLDLPDLAEDSRFASNAARVKNRDALRAIISAVLAEKPTALWVAYCAKANIPCGPLNHMHEVFADEQTRHRGLAISASHASGQDIRLVRSPLQGVVQGAIPWAEQAPPPQLGQHTQDILADLGLDEAAMNALRAKAII